MLVFPRFPQTVSPLFYFPKKGADFHGLCRQAVKQMFGGSEVVS